VTLESGGEIVARVPWAVVKGLRFRVDWSGSENVLGIMGAVGGPSSYPTETSATGFETLPPPGSNHLNLLG